MNIHIKVTVTNDPQKLYILLTSRRKHPREKKAFLQTEVKVELQINF